MLLPIEGGTMVLSSEVPFPTGRTCPIRQITHGTRGSTDRLLPNGTTQARSGRASLRDCIGRFRLRTHHGLSRRRRPLRRGPTRCRSRLPGIMRGRRRRYRRGLTDLLGCCTTDAPSRPRLYRQFLPAALGTGIAARKATVPTFDTDKRTITLALQPFRGSLPPHTRQAQPRPRAPQPLPWRPYS